MYRLEVRRRLCVPRINYEEERTELHRQMHYAVLLKAASRPVTQDYSKIVSTLPPKFSPKGNEELKKLYVQMQVAGLLKEASIPATEEYSNILSKLPVHVWEERPGENDNLANLHHQLARVTLLKAAWQLVDKSLRKHASNTRPDVPDKGSENYRTLKRKLERAEEDAESHKHRRVVIDTD